MGEFLSYFNSFYGVDGLYSCGRDISSVEVCHAVAVLLQEREGHSFEGDTIDREFIRDIMFTEEQIGDMYA